LVDWNKIHIFVRQIRWVSLHPGLVRNL
jgi:hypothetical protein